MSAGALANPSGDVTSRALRSLAPWIAPLGLLTSWELTSRTGLLPGSKRSCMERSCITSA
jgi:hypothetical protein